MLWISSLVLFSPNPVHNSIFFMLICAVFLLIYAYLSSALHYITNFRCRAHFQLHCTVFLFSPALYFRFRAQFLFASPISLSSIFHQIVHTYLYFPGFHNNSLHNYLISPLRILVLQGTCFVPDFIAFLHFKHISALSGENTVPTLRRSKFRSTWPNRARTTQNRARECTLHCSRPNNSAQIPLASTQISCSRIGALNQCTRSPSDDNAR